MIHPHRADNPFPGLRSFTPEEDHLFFGREEQTMDLLRTLGTHRFLAVVGTSGSGKSSLVRCGLLSQLLGGKMLAAGTGWEVAVTHPGAAPMSHLAESLLAADLYDATEEDAKARLLATLSRSHLGLIEAIRQAQLPAGTNFLLVVDQFEEIFRFNQGGAAQRDTANEFVSMLLQAAAQTDVPIYVVLTMRSDFIGDCAQFENLAEAVNRGEYLIPRMTREQFKQSIEGPIRVAGGTITPRLLQRLLNDLGDQTDQLPCLQHALMRTWDQWRRSSRGDEAPSISAERSQSLLTSAATRALDLEDYDAIGRMREALSRHADELYENLGSDRARKLCAALFKALTLRESENRGIRRPQTLGRLAQIVDVPAAELAPLIEVFRQPGVTFLMPPPEVPLLDPTVVDISHESLMRVWVRLRNWVEEEASSVGIFHRLAESAALHEKGKAGLYRDPELGIALSWRDDAHANAVWADQYGGHFDQAMAFLDRSRDDAEREEKEREAARQRELERAQQFAEAQAKVARLFKRFAGSLAVGLCLAIALTIWAFTLRREAQRQEAAAQQQRQLAQAKEKEATASEARASSAKATADRIAYSSQMLLAQSHWDSGNIKQLHAVLAETGSYPDRGFEWYYWQRLCQLDLLTFREHTKGVIAVAYSPDSRWVASGSDDATIKIWEAETGRVRLTLKGHLREVRCLAFSPDGRHLASGASDNTVKVWDTETGRLLTDFRKHDKWVESLAFSADGRRIGSRDVGWARVWDAETGRELIELATEFGGQRTALSPDFRRIAIGLKNGNVKVCDLETGRELFVTGRVPSVSTTWDWANSVAYSPDGRRIACGGNAAELCVWDAESGALVQAIEEAHQPGWTGVVVAFSPDGRRIASGATDNIIKIRETESGREMLAFRGHRDAVHSVAFSPDGRRLVSGSRDLTAKVWDLDPNREVLTLPGHTNGLSTVSFSADGKRFFSTDAHGTGIVWDTATARALNTWNLPSHFTAPGVIFPDGRRVALAQNLFFNGDQNKHIVVVFDVETGRRVSTFTGHMSTTSTGNSRGIDSVVVSPDGRRIASSGEGSVVKIWEAETGRELVSINGPGSRIMGLAFSPDGRRIAGSGHHGDGELMIWDADTGRQLHLIDTPAVFGKDVAFSPDGRQVAVTCPDSVTRVYDSESGQPLLTLQGHSGEVKGVAYSPDGRRIATCADNTIKLWEAESGRELLNLKNRRSGVNELAFSPDGQSIASGTFHGVAEVFRIAPASEVSRRMEEERAAQESLAKRAAALQEELAPIRTAEAKPAEEARARELAALAGTIPEPALKHQPRTQDRPLLPGDPGVIRQWLVLAPLPFEGNADLNVLRQQVPNEARLRPRAGERPAAAPAGLAWTAVRLGEDSYHLDFVELVNKAHPQADTVNQVAYAVAYIVSEKPQTGLTLLVGSDETARTYLNEKEIYRQLAPSTPWQGDRDEATGVQLNAGQNVLVFKVANVFGAWGGSVRFTTADGQPVKGIRVTLDPDAKK